MADFPKNVHHLKEGDEVVFIEDYSPSFMQGEHAIVKWLQQDYVHLERRVEDKVIKGVCYYHRVKPAKEIKVKLI